MNPELKSELADLITRLKTLQTESQQLVNSTDGNHPDARHLAEATESITDAITSLQAIKFGLESDFSYDD